MNRGELYRVTKPSSLDPKKYRIFKEVLPRINTNGKRIRINL